MRHINTLQFKSAQKHKHLLAASATVATTWAEPPDQEGELRSFLVQMVTTPKQRDDLGMTR